MGEIEIYKCPQIFNASQCFKIAKDLEEKNKKDAILLDKNFSKENNIAYKTNLLTYFYLMANGAIQISYVCDESVKLQKLGWFIWLQNYKISTSFPYKDEDELYTYWFDKYFDDYFINQDITIPYYSEATDNYKNNNLYACVCCLFPLIEYMVKKILKFDGNTIFHIKKELTNSKLSNVDGYKKYFDEFEDNLKKFLTTNIYKTSTEQDPEPNFICRNRILHGIFTREISKTDCLKLFCIIRSLDSINSWLNIINSIKNLSEELVKLQNN